MSAISLFAPSQLPQPPVDGSYLATRLAGKHAALVTGHVVLPGREGRYGELPTGLPDKLAVALRSRGVARLYAHQAESWAAVQRGQHVVVATPTASGKSFCYTLPVVAGAMRRRAKALYLFPTKRGRRIRSPNSWNSTGLASLGCRRPPLMAIRLATNAKRFGSMATSS